MKTLYDIHTHKIKPNTEREGYEVQTILNSSPAEFSSQKESSGNLWFSCGIHPWYAADSSKELEYLTEIVRDDRVVAVGEAGLDKLRGPDIQIQTEVFKAQIRLAEFVQKPLIIHCVKAWDELIALHKEFKSDIPWIIHGYRGNPEQTKQLVKLGFKFSIGEKFNPASLVHIPHESIFCETDESEYSICKIYQSISDCLTLDIEQFVDIIVKNMRRYFKNISK